MILRTRLSPNNQLGDLSSVLEAELLSVRLAREVRKEGVAASQDARVEVGVP